MRNFQKLLLDSLQRHHWSLDEVLKPEHWWEADVWAISSTRQQHGLQLFVTFVVDPGSLRTHDLSCVSRIEITRERLPHPYGTDKLVSLRQYLRGYPTDIEAAMARLDEVRNHDANAA